MSIELLFLFNSKTKMALEVVVHLSLDLPVSKSEKNSFQIMTVTISTNENRYPADISTHVYSDDLLMNSEEGAGAGVHSAFSHSIPLLELRLPILMVKSKQSTLPYSNY